MKKYAGYRNKVSQRQNYHHNEKCDNLSFFISSYTHGIALPFNYISSNEWKHKGEICEVHCETGKSRQLSQR